MKLNERYIEVWHEDKDYYIYQVILPGGKSVTFILEGAEKRFVAAFEHIDNARDAICGWPITDQEENEWELEVLKDGTTE